MEYSIETRELTKSYNGIAIVDSVNLTVPKGCIYGLIGRNGAGKSTLIKMLAGLTIPTSGKIELIGRSEKKGLRQARQKMGFFIETPSFFNDLNAVENLEYYRILKGYPRRSIIADAIELVGLEEHCNKPYRVFSFGMRQRLSLALALMGDPEVVVLDEPTNGLDPQGLELFKEIILKINKEKNTTFMIASHMLTDLSEIADYFGFMSDGRLLEQTSKNTLRDFCRTCTVLSVDDTSRASVVIERELGTSDFEIMPNNTINIYDLEKNGDLIDALVASSIKIESVYTKKTTLNDYFLEREGGVRHD